jgi:hypothetical protein
MLEPLVTPPMPPARAPGMTRCPPTAATGHAWNRWVTQALEVELIARDLVTEQMFPILIERRDLSHVYSKVGASETLDGSTSVQVDNQLLGLMARRASQTALAVSNLEELKASADTVLDSIEQALSR